MTIPTRTLARQIERACVIPPVTRRAVEANARLHFLAFVDRPLTPAERAELNAMETPEC